MWYLTLLNGKMDGLEPLLALFKNEDEFIKYFFSKVKFFNPTIVKEHSDVLLAKIKEGDYVPVRYSMKTKEYFYYKNKNTNTGTSKKTFKNKVDAQNFAFSQDLFHKETDIKVCIDKDGNYYVRREIFNAIGYKVSQGAISDIRNYMISHIWDYTENPLFFTSLWNITLIPHFLAFILDKPDNDGLIGKIKNISKAICLQLYEPNKLMGKHLIKADEEACLREYKSLIDFYINDKTISFIEPNELNTPKSYCDPKDIVDALSFCEKNKDFVLTLLEKLKSSEIEFVQVFTNKQSCKDICKMSYPILIDVTGNSPKEIKKKMSIVNSDIYYSNTFFEFDNKKYIVCNDWKTDNKNRIIQWLTGSKE